MSESLKVLFLAAEADPFIKVGGLADVAGSLPLALRALPPEAAAGEGLDVRLVLPLHRALAAGFEADRLAAAFNVRGATGDLPAYAFQRSLDGMPVYFVGGELLSGAASVYSPDPQPDRLKYAFFSLAALELVRHLGWAPDVVHAHDWHTALALYALHAAGPTSSQRRPRTVLTVHNLPYMGGDAADALAAYGLEPPDDRSLPEWGQTQLLPLGLWSADAVVAVSPAYAAEILTPEFGCGLDPYLRSRSGTVTGILNGLDLAAWDPSSDPALAARFTTGDLAARAANKAALQARLGLPRQPAVPLLAMIGRLDPQKGADLALQALRDLGPARPWQFVLLGTGSPTLEDQARSLQAELPERARAEIRFDAALGRLLYSGADMLLMPSRYEPCGLAQMIAMRYGCVPVVRATGGLRDTVEEGRTGFLFPDPSPASLREALDRALEAFADRRAWERLQRNGMTVDFSWERSARQYARLYRSSASGAGPIRAAGRRRNATRQAS
jgi:starch synthase